MEDEFFISFDTKINPGKIEAIRVRIDVVTVDGTDPRHFDIGLCDHPLYSDLVEYVRENPR